MSDMNFVEQIAGYVRKLAPDYGIKVFSPIIAQAILESNWGKSQLSAKYHNYFGLKCGSSWKGASVNMKTKEEYKPGTLTTIKDNFRAYSSMEEGVKGYFEFIQYSRYKNLKGITDPKEYLETIRADGYATSSTYVVNNMNLITKYGLTKYDGEEVPAADAPAQEENTSAWIDEAAKEVLAGKWGNGQDRKDRLYNAIQSRVNELTRHPQKSVDELAHEVIAGKWGNGQDRRNRLTAEGYDYDAVQARVNALKR